MKHWRWFVIAAVSALAGHLAVQSTTPIDRALPLLALLATALAAVSYPSIVIAVPLLIVVENVIPEEGMRLLAIGAVMAAVAAAAAARRNSGWVASPTIAVIIILLLRWISVDHIVRELFLLAIAALIVLVLDRTPLAIMIAVVTVLFTPAVPLRTFALPLFVLAIVIAARTMGMPRLVLAWPSSIVVGFVVLFFPWSGVVARGIPYFLKRATKPLERIAVNRALAPREELTLDVPDGAHSLIVSGANVARLHRGALLGSIEPGGIAVRIGDAADWGYQRRDQFHASRNPLPRDPAGRIRGYGYRAWLDGAGRVALPANARTIHITADAALPADAALQVEGFE